MMTLVQVEQWKLNTKDNDKLDGNDELILTLHGRVILIVIMLKSSAWCSHGKSRYCYYSDYNLQ